MDRRGFLRRMGVVTAAPVVAPAAVVGVLETAGRASDPRTATFHRRLSVSGSYQMPSSDDFYRLQHEIWLTTKKWLETESSLASLFDDGPEAVGDAFTVEVG